MKYMISSFNFFHFPLVIWPFFFSNFKWKFSFQISKMKIFNFLWHISIFSFPSRGMTNFFKFQNRFFQFFSISCGGMAIFFQILKTKFSIQISKNKFFQILLVA
jgi:hypothetical protein